MFFRMARDPWLKPKTVILSHDIAHRYGSSSTKIYIDIAAFLMHVTLYGNFTD